MKLPKVKTQQFKPVSRNEKAIRVARVLGGVSQSNDMMTFGQATRDWMKVDNSARRAFIRWYEKQP